MRRRLALILVATVAGLGLVACGSDEACARVPMPGVAPRPAIPIRPALPAPRPAPRVQPRVYVPVPYVIHDDRDC
jgi:hypothetical protein